MKKIYVKSKRLVMRIPTDQEYERLMDVTQEENVIARWEKMFSWVNDTNDRYRMSASTRAARGYFSARNCRNVTAAYQSVFVGFRPVVELTADALPPDTQDGEAVIVGTLYMDGVPVLVPQKPTWDGDIADYISGAKLEMRPALENPAYQVTAIRVGNVLVADRNLLKFISYNDLERRISYYDLEKAASSEALLKNAWKWYTDDADNYTCVRELRPGKVYEVLHASTRKGTYLHQAIYLDDYSDERLTRIMQRAYGDRSVEDYLLDCALIDGLEAEEIVKKPDSTIDREKSTVWLRYAYCVAARIAETMPMDVLPDEEAQSLADKALNEMACCGQ